MERTIELNGLAVAVPAGAVAYRFASDGYGAAWLYDLERAADEVEADEAIWLVGIAGVSGPGVEVPEG